MSFTVIIDDRDVLAGIRELEKRGQDLRPVFREIRPLIRRDIVEHFQRRSGPSGGWPKWSRSYVEKRLGGAGVLSKRHKRRGRRVLTKRGRKRFGNMLGALKSAWKFRLGRQILEATNIVPWAGVHQFGGMAGRGASIPARPFAYVSPETVAEATKRIRDYVRAAF